MKITVIADRSGKIVGFSHVRAGTATSSKVMTAIDAEATQTVHEVELSPDLAARAHDDDFADAIFQHVVMKRGKTATLARPSAPAARTKNARK